MTKSLASRYPSGSCIAKTAARASTAASAASSSAGSWR